VSVSALLCKGTSIKQLMQKMLFCFTNISLEILLHLFGYNFCAESHILAHFCQMLSPLKALKLSAQKLLCFGAENVDGIEGLDKPEKYLVGTNTPAYFVTPFVTKIKV